MVDLSLIHSNYWTKVPGKYSKNKIEKHRKLHFLDIKRLFEAVCMARTTTTTRTTTDCTPLQASVCLIVIKTHMEKDSTALWMCGIDLEYYLTCWNAQLLVIGGSRTETESLLFSRPQPSGSRQKVLFDLLPPYVDNESLGNTRILTDCVYLICRHLQIMWVFLGPDFT